MFFTMMKEKMKEGHGDEEKEEKEMDEEEKVWAHGNNMCIYVFTYVYTIQIPGRSSVHLNRCDTIYICLKSFLV